MSPGAAALGDPSGVGDGDTRMEDSRFDKNTRPSEGVETS